jgi:DNA-binding CsgD family transcriptional regulator
MEQTVEAILGRGVELARIRDFIDSAASGPSALMLEGAAGIGKTTLWHSGVRLGRARGCQVLSCRAAESEARLSYAGLGDLLDLALPALPAPQKRALDAALLRSEVAGPSPDQRAVSVASLAVLRALAASRPLIVAIDDVQWLDAPSSKVLSFVVRRLEDEPINLLITLRAGAGGDPLTLSNSGPPLRLDRLSLQPLGLEAMSRLLRSRAGNRLPRPALARLHRISEGNPFFALEIARALDAQAGFHAPGEPPPVPEDLQALLRARLAAMSSEATEILPAVAAAIRPTEDLILAIVPRPRARAGLIEAERAQIIQRRDGRIFFTHPLLGSAVYAAVPPDERRRLHGRLAQLVLDQEERARHLALATSGPDANVAEALEKAARHARARAAPDAAAELSELARRLTPTGQRGKLLDRTVQAAQHHFDAGDAPRSTTLLEEAIQLAAPGPDRAGMLFRLASISWLDMCRVQELAEQALEEAGDNPELLAPILEHLAWVGIYRGDLSFSRRHAKASIDLAPRLSEPWALAEPLATFAMVEFLVGRPSDEFITEAERLQDLKLLSRPEAEPTMFSGPRACHGLQLLWAGELDASRRILQEELAEYEKRGRYVVRDELLCYLAELESRAGNWTVAARHAQEAYEIDLESGRLLGQGHMLFPKALVAALQGDVESARSDAEEGLRLCRLNEDELDAACHAAVLGFLELSLSNPIATIDHLHPVLAFLDSMGTPEPGVIPCAPDAIEALISLGRLEEAEDLLNRLEKQGRDLHRPWAIATAARCRGLMSATQGEMSRAHAAFERALIEHQRVPQPFEQARTMLVKGEVERRAKQKRAAKASLEHALGAFETLGAPLWAARARADLNRLGTTVSSPGELTPTEHRIAQLVADGRKNREIADALFISVKTVEANLSRIFHKLNVRSRTELTRHIVGMHQASERK